MPYRRKVIIVRVCRSRHQSKKKTIHSKGIFSWDIIWTDEKGKRKQKTIQGTKKNADKEAFVISLQLQKLLSLTPEQLEELKRMSTTLDESFLIFIKAKTQEGVSEDTIEKYQRTWLYFTKSNNEEQIFIHSKAPGTVAGLAPKHLRNFIAYLRMNSFGRDGKSTIKTHTQGKYCRHVRSYLKWLHENDYVVKDPTRGVKGPALPTINVKSLTPEQVQYALEKTSEHPRGDEIFVLILAYLYLGCRATEILPPLFTWDHFHGHTIERPNLKQKKAEVEYIIISLEGEDGKTLRQILENRLKCKDRWVIRDGNGKPIKDKNGNLTSAPFPYTYWQVRRLITYDFFPSIGLKGANLQMLRDTAATLRQLSGQPLSAVSILLGHSDPSVTMKYYTDKGQIIGSVAGSLNVTTRKKFPLP